MTRKWIQSLAILAMAFFAGWGQPLTAQSKAATAEDSIGAPGTVACGINDRGEIVGYFYDQDSIGHGFTYSGGYTAKWTSRARLSPDSSALRMTGP